MEPIPYYWSRDDLEDEIVFTRLLIDTLEDFQEDYEQRKAELEERLAELQHRFDLQGQAQESGSTAGPEPKLFNSNSGSFGSSHSTSESFSDIPTAGITAYGSEFESANNPDSFNYLPNNNDENISQTSYKKRQRLSIGQAQNPVDTHDIKRRRTGLGWAPDDASHNRSASSNSGSSHWRHYINTNDYQSGSISTNVASRRALQRQEDAERLLRQQKEDEHLALTLQQNPEFDLSYRPTMSEAKQRRSMKDYAYGTASSAHIPEKMGFTIKSEVGPAADQSKPVKFPTPTHRYGFPSSQVLTKEQTSFPPSSSKTIAHQEQDAANLSDGSLEEISPQTFEQSVSLHERVPKAKNPGSTMDNETAEGVRSLIIDLESEGNDVWPPDYGYSDAFSTNSNWMHHPSYGQHGAPVPSWISQFKQYTRDTWDQATNSFGSYLEDFGDFGYSMTGESSSRIFGNVPPYGTHSSTQLGTQRSVVNSDLTKNTYIDVDAPGYEIGPSDPQKTKEEINRLLENIRPDEDLAPEKREGTPEAMKVTLMEHQKVGLTWLKSMETGSNKGGILADDMGLGKTIQAMSLIVSRPSEDPRQKTTLIVAPVSLMRQWDREIKSKVKPGRYKLSVHIHHGASKKNSFAAMSDYDVVLTTFGTLASELKKKRAWEAILKDHPDARPRAKDRLYLLGDECNWYRVIIDEAQCIKNKGTATAQAARLLHAKYRLCMTGTPMMNNVTELYSLINFLRIKPYCDWYKFNVDIGRPLSSSGNEYSAARAMPKLQALLKAICLRRSKFSKMDGKPILEGLPPRATHEKHAEFSKDERDLYKAVESKTQLQFNRYLESGSVGRNYTTILVLLLRLRQACCHPYLLKDFGVKVVDMTSSTADKMLGLARQLDPDVVNRIKAAEGAFECPICLDAVESPSIFFPCGHDTCSECFARLADPSRAIAEGHVDSATTKCPECRRPIESQNVIDYAVFKKVHIDGDQVDEGRSEMNGETAATNDHQDSQSDEDDSDTENGSSSCRKGKGKQVGIFDRESGIASSSMRAIAGQNGKRGGTKKERRKYLRHLRRNWQSSAKVEEAMSLLRAILAGDETEKVLVFSQFTSLLDLVEVPIEQEGWAYRRYDGSMNSNERNEAIVEFTEQRDMRIMLISLKAGNAGLNLNAASQVIMLDPFWNPYVEEQAVDRAHRIGQTRMVNVHRILVQDTVEDRILALQEKKRKLISTALDEEAGQSVSRLGTRELAYLFGVAPNPTLRA